MRNHGPKKKRSGAYFFAQGRPIYQLLGDQELGWVTTGVFVFFK